jgi:O-acetylserine/cysteine efflux transporter
MSRKEKLAAAVLVTIWGLNFIAIKVGLGEMPPLLLGALRFVFVVFPAVLFLPRPNVPLGPLLAYGLTISFGQFAFLFSAIYAGMPAGLASLVLQVQAFISPLIGAVVLHERLQGKTIAGLSIAFAGLVILVVGGHDTIQVPLLGFALTLCAATSWAVGNILSKSIGPTDPMGLVAWSGLIPIAPFLIASAAIEGAPRMQYALAHISITTLAAVAYLSYGASLIGYGIWSSLIARHPVQQIAPLALLVPVIGIASTWLLLGEALSAWQVLGSLVIIAGLLLNMFGHRLPVRILG